MKGVAGMPIGIEIGDITGVEVDAIVNTANCRLLGGGGVDGAVHRAAGPRLIEACRSLPARSNGIRCSEGEAVVTPGFDLPCRIVVHTVGPVWQGGGFGEAETLARCHRSAIRAADAHRARSIAFPAISTGAYGFPVRLAAPIAVRSVAEALAAASSVERATFVLFEEELQEPFEAALSALLRGG